MSERRKLKLLRIHDRCGENQKRSNDPYSMADACKMRTIYLGDILSKLLIIKALKQLMKTMSFSETNIR